MSIASLIATGTKVWLDDVEPDAINCHRAWGITGATSNPAIVSKAIGRGQFNGRISNLIAQGHTDHQIAWELGDELVRSAQQVFFPVWERTEGNDGYVSFELDPLIEDDTVGLNSSERIKRYLELGQKWSAGHKNRMIKVPASGAGLDALEGLAAAGVTINVTLPRCLFDASHALKIPGRGAEPPKGQSCLRQVPPPWKGNSRGRRLHRTNTRREAFQ